MPIALTTAAFIDLAIVGATLLLALGTFWMAWGQTTQRQHDEAIAPILRVARISLPGDVEMCVVNEGHQSEASETQTTEIRDSFVELLLEMAKVWGCVYRSSMTDRFERDSCWVPAPGNSEHRPNVHRRPILKASACAC